MSRAPSDNPAEQRFRTDEPLLWLSGAGHQLQTDTGYYFNASSRKDRPHVTLQYTIDGSGFYRDRRGQSLLPSGWAFIALIPGEFEYGYAPPVGRPYELVYVSIYGPDVVSWYERITSAFGHALNVGVDSRVKQLMLAIAHARETDRLPDRYVISGQIYQLLMEVYSSLTRTRLSTSPRVTQAIEQITAHADDAGYGISQLAQAVDCSREHLTRIFRAATGVSPSDYLTQQRLRRGAGLLRSTEDKLETIARRCGFSNANYFCRSFREHVGTTPAKFRKQPWLMGP